MPSATTARPRWHVEYLDALRGLAVLGVLFVHAGTNSALPQPWSNIAYSGQRGVQLFFVVSAFTLLLSHENRRKAEARPTLNFFLRRFFRLAPMYYLAILLTLWLAPDHIGSRRDLLLGVLFLHGISPHTIFHAAPGAWTISDEMFFYALLPLLIWLIQSLRSALLWLLLLTPAMAVLSLLLIRHDPADHTYYAFFWFPIELPVFLLGIVAYFVWKQLLAGRFAENSTTAKRLSLLLLLAAAVIYALNLPLDNRKLYFFSFGFALLLLALSVHPWHLLVNRFTVFLGRISYSVYLLHFWILEYLIRRTMTPAWQQSPLSQFGVRFLATLLLTMAVAALTWLYIEEGGIGLGRSLIARLESRSAAALPLPSAAPGLGEAAFASKPDEQF